MTTVNLFETTGQFSITEVAMVVVLRSKLTREEFLALYELMDADPPAGPLWEAMGDAAQQMAPELFVNGVQDQDVKVEERSQCGFDDPLDSTEEFPPL